MRAALLALAFLTGCSGQPAAPASQRLEDRQPAPFPAALTKDLEDLRDAALKSDYSYGLVKKICAVGPRLAGSQQAEQAVDLVEAELARLNIPVQREKVMVPHWVRGEERAVMEGQRLSLTALGGSGATPKQGLEAPVVVVRSWDELAATDVAGKIVFFDVPFDEAEAAEGLALKAYGRAVPYRARGPAEAGKKGAVAALVRSVGSGNLPHTGETEFPEGQKPLPAAALAVPDAEKLAARAEKGPVKVRLVLTPQNLPPVPSWNLIADLKGTQPDQLVLVTAHLDSWDLGTGAGDNAAGVAMAVETANLVRQLQPKRTLRVVIWMSEELTQAGAHAYLKDHQAELPGHFAAIENDLGAADPIRIDAMVGERTLQVLEPLKKVLEPLGAGHLRVSQGTRVDLVPLAEAGVPCFSPIQDTRTLFDYHHTTDDILARVEPASLQKNCAVTAVLAYALTQLP